LSDRELRELRSITDTAGPAQNLVAAWLRKRGLADRDSAGNWQLTDAGKRAMVSSCTKPRRSTTLAVSGTIATDCGRPRSTRLEPRPEGVSQRGIGTAWGALGSMTTAPAYDNSVRIGCARVSTLPQEHLSSAVTPGQRPALPLGLWGAPSSS
jgi:hypothetical protein